ncbi:hypothetical protein BPOR_0130g00060 [Botrytis porri]|uniref:Uncharacterized protein n=1 Tax=Botrytis porri TaxID=87229 RepID=A0A4Z1KWQ3_9HELO|nr:hypothetical protein BPOR_0130g00060 [Botrytis porri]
MESPSFSKKVTTQSLCLAKLSPGLETSSQGVWPWKIESSTPAEIDLLAPIQDQLNRKRKGIMQYRVM